MGAEDLDDLGNREGIDAVRARIDAAEVVNFKATKIAAIVAEVDKAGRYDRDTLRHMP
jgi:hypothetical protein